MIDRRALEQWVRPPHLEAAALDAYREAFTAHPARLLSLDQVLRPDLADSVYTFLATEARYEPRYGLYSGAGAVSGDAWREAPEAERFFRFGKLAGVRSEFRLSRHLVDFMKLRAALVDPRFKAYLETITGLRLGTCSPPYAHAFGAGDFLNLHDDDNDDRCLTLVLHLSKDWTPELGGAFHMIDPGGESHVMEAGHNTLVLFDVTAKTQHFIAPIRARAGQLRLSLGCWFHRPARPEEHSGDTAQTAG